MKLPLLASALLLLAPAVLATAEPTPVGTWEITLSGAEQGLAFATFEEDKELTGYSLSDDAPGIFTLAGTWDIDEKGRLTGNYIRVVNGQSVNGTLAGKVAGRGITGKIVAENGNFNFKAKPQGTPLNLTGDWSGLAVQKRTKVGQSYTVVPTALPGVFDIIGSGLAPLGGDFPITGTAVVHSTGRVQILTSSELDEDAVIISALAGKVNVAKKQNVLKGFETTGEPVKVTLER
ncbi:MAG: hypothetical protein B9S38_09995 [Verrucomicrobiia bacterium Tous-C4TDCM]|nr:MAG: hypothetical protein B9S38_09995 [Verrucomicrobiae bacterium Tous-C4TDCM]